ncbi:MAG: cell division protein ZapA [Bacteroidales bacterium]|nr:cell division protein ZapA [Bacteroidales bacterium]
MKQNINLKIGGLEYPLTIDSELEEGMREAAERINKEMGYLMDHYGNTTKEKVLCMMLLRTEMKLLEIQKNDTGEASVLKNEVDAINSELEDYLHSR